MRLLICFLLAATGWTQTGMMQVHRPVGASYLISESFDSATACGDGVATNCSATWTMESSPTIAFNSTTSPAPLEGTYSLIVGASASASAGASRTFSSQDTVHFFVMLNHKTLVGGNISFVIKNGATQLLKISNANPEWRIACGSVLANSAVAITQGTTYYVWGDYTKGTGSNAVCNLYYSTTSTKPVSPGITVTTGDATLQASGVLLENSSTTAVSVFDKLRISTAAIGSSPL